MREGVARFAGEVLRSGPLQSGLGQLEWLSYQTGGHGSLPNVTLTFAVPDGLPDDAVTDALTTLLLRHEVLRTSFDADAEGRPRQNVHASVEVAFTRIDGPDSRRAFTEAPFDVATRPPVRFGRTREGELVVTISHIAIDGMAAWLLGAELTELLDAYQQGRVACLSGPVPQPVERALHERGEGRARAESALRHWSSTLRDFPATVLPVGRGRPGAGVVRADLESRAAGLALARLHEALGAAPASIFTAAVYTALAIQLGRDRLGLNLTWSFREYPTTAAMIAAVFRDMPLLVDLGDRPSFTEVLRRLQRAVLLAGRHMSFDVLEFHECAGHAEVERGAFLPGPEVVSITLDLDELEPVQPDVDPRVLLAESRTTTYQTNESWDVCNLYVGAAPTEGRLLIEARLDASVMEEKDSAALAALIEAILVHAATSPDLTFAAAEALSTGRPRRPARSARVGDVLVDLDFLTERLQEHPGVYEADVDADGEGLTARVTADLEPWQLHDFLLSTDNGRTAVLAPARFVVRRTDGVTVAGPGADRPSVGPQGAAEHALRDAVAEANQLSAVTMAGTYLTVGGRLHLAPRTLALLRASGFEGIAVADLRRPTSLVTLAGRLRRTASQPAGVNAR